MKSLIISALMLAAASPAPYPLPATAPPGAAVLVVAVSGLPSDAGEVGCALFRTPDGFPLNVSGARVLWQSARRAGVECRFADVPPGTYALAVSHDLNGNRRTDRNLVGIPTEAWGVSNDVRPRLRAPRFAEAAFEVADGATRRLAVRVAR